MEAGPLVRSSYHAGAQFRRALDASAPVAQGRDQALSGHLNRGLFRKNSVSRFTRTKAVGVVNMLTSL